MFNKYVSISIPDGDNLKNVVARYTDREINLIDGVNESESLQIHNNFSNNCSYVILLPAEKIFYQSVPVADRDQFKVSEENLLPD